MSVSITCLPLRFEAETSRWVRADRSLRVRIRTWGDSRWVRIRQQLTPSWASLQMILYLVRWQQLRPQGQIHSMDAASTGNIDIREKMIPFEDPGGVKWHGYHEEPFLCVQPNTQLLIS